MENSKEIPLKTKNRNTIWSNSSTLGYISKESKNINSKRYMHPSAHSNIIYNSQDTEANHVSINRWMERRYTHTHAEILFNLKKNEILPFAKTWMDIEKIMVSEISQTENDSVWCHLYVESKTNVYSQTETENKMVVTNGKTEERARQGYGIKRFELPCIK